VAFRDESGRELFDLPDAPRPGGDVAAPVRFLGEFDNVLLGHADRTRIIPTDFPWAAMLAPGRFVNNLLVDGILRATWWIERDTRTLGIRPPRGVLVRRARAGRGRGARRGGVRRRRRRALRGAGVTDSSQRLTQYGGSVRTKMMMIAVVPK
jgi:hypothetical protein